MVAPQNLKVSSPEPSAALLVHFSPGRDAVDGHEENLLGLDHPEQNLDVVEDVGKDLLL